MNQLESAPRGSTRKGPIGWDARLIRWRYKCEYARLELVVIHGRHQQLHFEGEPYVGREREVQAGSLRPAHSAFGHMPRARWQPFQGAVKKIATPTTKIAMVIMLRLVMNAPLLRALAAQSFCVRSTPPPAG